MHLKSHLIAAITYAAKLYKKSPIKPFGRIFSKLYFGAINAGEGFSMVHKSINGINYELDLREVIDSQMFYAGSREPDTSRTLELLCRKGDVVIDIGANVGSHTLPMAHLVGDAGQVYAFEPVPWAIGKLKRNLNLNDFKNIETEQIALSDENHAGVEMEFRASFKIEAGQGVDKQGQINQDWWRECERVVTKMQTLDSYVQEHGLARVNLIKLDVDGFEGKVIRGALNTLKQHKPFLIMEIAPAWVAMRGDPAIKIAKQLLGIGYRCFSEVTFDEFLDVERMIHEIPSDGGVNVVFAPDRPRPQNTMSDFC